MKTEKAKRLIDSFHEAKHVLSCMPPLEKGLTPLSVHVIDIIHEENEKGKAVKPSQISEKLHLTRPGITRTLKQLEKLQMIEKKSDERDGRSVGIHLTGNGERIYEKYVDAYYAYLTDILKDISEKDADVVIRTIHQVNRLVSENRMEEQNGKRK